MTRSQRGGLIGALVAVVMVATGATTTACGPTRSVTRAGRVQAATADFPWSSNDVPPFWSQPAAMAATRVAISGDTLFELDSSELTPAGSAELAARISSWVTPGVRMRVDAWASADGDSTYNMALSLARAGAVAVDLERLGVARAQIDVVAHGEDDLPVQPPADPRNRVVVVTVTS